MMQEKYEVTGDRFAIIDDELGISIDAELEFLDKDHFPDGSLRYETYRKEDKLHGPSNYYANLGGILSQSWYFEGIKIGKSWRYYPNGQLYCLERFVEGVPHLAQEYYYLDGSLKTIIHFEKGIYHGITKLFWPDGTMKRECQFERGKMITDNLYDEHGNLAKTLS